MERLPAKVQKIQKELPAWIEKTGNKDKAVAPCRNWEDIWTPRT